MARRKNDTPPPTADELPEGPVSLLETPAPTGALTPTPFSDSPLAQAPEALASPFTVGGASPLRAALPELDEIAETSGASGRSWGASSSTQAPPSPFGSPRRTASAPKVQSLEELYAMVPDITEMGSRLRVERTTPEWVSTPQGKTATSGVLGYLTDTPSTQEFARRFGGRTYNVYAMVDTAPKNNPGGPPMEQCRGIAELKIPLDPNLDCLPIIGLEEDDQEQFDMSRAYQFFRPNQQGGQTFVVPMQGQQQAPAAAPVSLDPMLNFAGRMVEIANRQQPQQQPQQPDPNFVAEMAERPARMLQQQLDELKAENRSLRQNLEQNSSKPSTEVAALQAMAGVMSSMKGSATGEEIEGLRRQHEREIERMTRQHEEDRNRMVIEHTATMNVQQKDHQNAIDRLERERAGDNDRLRRDLESERQRFSEKERDLREAHEKELRANREEADRRLREMNESFDRRERDARLAHDNDTLRTKEMYESRIKDLERTHNSQLEMHKMHGDTLHTTVKMSSDVQINALQTKVAELTAQLSSAQARASQLEQENRPKPFLEQLGEITQTASAVGFVKPGDVAASGAAEGEEMSTRDRLIQTFAEGAAQRLPELIQATGMGSMIGRVLGGMGGGDAAPAGQAQPRRVNVTQVNAQHQQLPPPQRLIFADSDGAPVELPGQSQRGPDLGPPQPAPVQQQPAQQPQQQPARQQAPVQQQQQAPQPAPQPPQTPWAGFEWTNLPDDTLTSVFGTIMQGLKDEATPEKVVEILSAQFTAEMVGAIPSIASVDKVIASIRKAPVTARSPLASPQGRAYIRDVWAAMSKMAAAKQEGTTA